MATAFLAHPEKVMTIMAHSNTILFTFTIHIPYSIISNDPAPINTHPMRLFTVNSSCRKIKASASVMITLDLSMGTTFEVSPTWSAL